MKNRTQPFDCSIAAKTVWISVTVFERAALGHCDQRCRDAVERQNRIDIVLG